jgi:hypothetical protein
MAGVVTMAGGWQAFDGQLPRYFDAQAIHAAAGKLLVGGGQNNEADLYSKSMERVFAGTQAVVLLSTDNKRFAPVFTAPGEIAHLSATRSGRVYALGRRFVGKAAKAFVASSADGGRGWGQPVAAPDGVVGVAFETDTRGFAWSPAEVHHTADAGLHWTKLLGFKSFDSGALPALGPEGELWVPDRVALLDIVPGEKPRLVAYPKGFTPALIAPGAKGQAWVAGTGDDKKHVLILRVDAGGQVQPAGELPAFSPQFLGARGQTLVLTGSDTQQTPPALKVFVGAHGGRAWAPDPPKQDSLLDPVCMDDLGGLWGLGTGGRVLRRAP